MFIPGTVCGIRTEHVISIQLLFLFIFFKRLRSFTGSHISIQLLFLFINCELITSRYPRSFQYNSCFCLSGKGKTVPYGDYNFNTTLVFVYLNCECGRQWLQAFQYNSCFCLSFWDIAKTEMENLFQYNSCFCLSNAFKPFFFFIIASFPDKINVLHDFSQPFSIFLLFLRISLLSAILSGSSAFLHIQRLGNSDVI